MRNGYEVEGIGLLDRVRDLCREGEVGAGMHDLFEGLLELKRSLSPEAWSRFRRRTAVDHDLRGLIHQDPMTRRSFEKPRGYAGDAVLLDYIYRLRGPAEASTAGRGVYEFANSRPAAASVRERKALLAGTLDRIAAERRGKVRVLSVAAGHLRELRGSRAVAEGRVEEFIALDSDPETVAVVDAEFPWVETRALSFSSLFREEAYRGHFDFVYSAGLYDYLQTPMARKLTACLFACLRDQGVLLVSNFLPQVIDAGYMESYMAWDLIYRTEEEIADLDADIPDRAAYAKLVRVDALDTIGYLELRRGQC